MEDLEQALEGQRGFAEVRLAELQSSLDAWVEGKLGEREREMQRFVKETSASASDSLRDSLQQQLVDSQNQQDQMTQEKISQVLKFAVKSATNIVDSKVQSAVAEQAKQTLDRVRNLQQEE